MNDEQRNLEKENEELKAQLKEYEPLHEDQMARRVFEKARKLFFVYMTVGGVALALSGFFGVRELLSYTRNVVQNKVDELAADVVEKQCEVAVSELATTEVRGFIDCNRDPIMDIAREVLETWLVTQGQPVAGTYASTSVSQGDLILGGALDYSSELPPVRYQGTESCCVAFAVTAALEYSARQITGEPIELSPRFVYFLARREAGRPLDIDSGINVTEAVRALAEVGIIAEDAWPYVSGQYAQLPPPDVEEAIHYELSEPEVVVGAEGLREALEKGPVVGALAVFQSLDGDDIKKTGVIPMPEVGERVRGATGVCFVGCDDELERFKFRNSWGSDWGDGGYGYVSYEYADAYMNDAWSLSLAGAP